VHCTTRTTRRRTDGHRRLWIARTTLVASELFVTSAGRSRAPIRRGSARSSRRTEERCFLDEIGELPEALQAVLLGVLERRRFRKLGGKRDITVDVRLVTATNRDLRAEVNARRFRLDLYHRLAVVTLQLPPLRERPEDVRCSSSTSSPTRSGSGR